MPAARPARRRLYLSNMFFAINAADYFAPDVSTNPMLHTWSLGVEEQFYLFWPLLIVLGLGFLRSKRSLLTLMALLTVASLAACLWLTANRGALAFYALPLERGSSASAASRSCSRWTSSEFPRSPGSPSGGSV